jgi:hypothetical protein
MTWEGHKQLLPVEMKPFLESLRVTDDKTCSIISKGVEEIISPEKNAKRIHLDFSKAGCFDKKNSNFFCRLLEI